VPDGSERASLAPLPLQRLHGLPQAFLRILQANGVCVVPDGTERAFLAPLPLQHLYGVPAPTLRLLQASGLITIGELQRVPKAALQAAFGPSEGLLLWRSARGLDPLPRNAQAGFRSRLICSRLQRVAEKVGLQPVLRASPGHAKSSSGKDLAS